MAKTHEFITDDLQKFIRAQHVFFVATAPLDGGGHINLSPKGLDCFRILSPTQVAYLDLTGSGNETSAHVQENGRLTFMFCAFDGPPNILRLYGKGRTILPGSPQWDAMSAHFQLYSGARQIIAADITRVQTSCGFGVPLMEYVGERDQLTRWAEKKGEAELATYRQQKNVCSIDSLPTPLAINVNEQGLTSF
jgi:Pyridoxamine 5'-phosphate oxidase